MSDFPDISSEFATAPSSAVSASGDIDFDRAASAFPDISFDGESTTVPSTYGALSAPSNDSGSVEFSFDDFDTPPKVTDVKVTGDDEIEKFEDQFPELDVPGPQVRVLVSHIEKCNVSCSYLHVYTANNVSSFKTDIWGSPTFCTISAAVVIH